MKRTQINITPEENKKIDEFIEMMNNGGAEKLQQAIDSVRNMDQSILINDDPELNRLLEERSAILRKKGEKTSPK